MLAEIVVVLSLIGPQSLAADTAEPAASDAEGLELFETEIRPVLVESCHRCHAAASRRLKGGLRVDGRAELLRGGDSGPAIEPGDPAASLLLKALRYDGELHMPPSGKLPEDVIASFERWLARGAPMPPDGPPARAGEDLVDGSDEESAEPLWSLVPPRRAAAPSATTGGTSPSTVDRLVDARLRAEGLTPNPPERRRALIRRVTFVLTGLPPRPEDVEAFASDDEPDAYERLVDRLLASPHCGERWARRWLDVARYAEDQAHIVGDNESLFYPNAWRYRDWVIGALNDDLPYDRFVGLQLAADLLEPDAPESHVALGYLGLGPKYYGRGSLAVKADEWEDRVDVVCRGLLGLTVACARCHDHKYDPIETEDYYALAGVFASTRMFNRPIDDRREASKDGQAKSPDDAIHIVREGSAQDLHVFVRGNVENKGPVVPRRFPSALTGGEPRPFEHGSGRAELAEAIIAPSNPLTARVFVNRIWGEVFGRPLVATTSNFGSLGARPSHPELLDDLALRFQEAGWSLKWLLRELVLSDTFRRSSEVVAAKAAVDPGNRLLWRSHRRRLDVESWRDAILAASAELDRSIGGPSIDPTAPEGRRRTLYSAVSRFDLHPLLKLFDFPDPNAHAARRAETTTPLQKLFALNSPFVSRQARALADRLRAERPGADTDALSARVRRAYALLFARPPGAQEIRWALELVRGTDDAEAWRRYAQVLLASNELLFTD